MDESKERKIHIFVSYNHEDTVAKLAVTRQLTDAGFIVRSNNEGHEQDPLHIGISKNINLSDVAIPLMTKHWLASHECRDELVRANERRKIIVPFRHRDVEDGKPIKIPHFLADTQYVSWAGDGTITSAVSELIALLRRKTLQANWQLASFEDARVIGDVVQKCDDVTPQWRRAMSRLILSTTRSTIKKVLNGDECEFDVSRDASYLRHAVPIFGHAQSIIAICIASVSRFWTDSELGEATGDYLKDQKESAQSIRRLFVFKSAGELNDFKEVLRVHHKMYGFKRPTNGVFLSSLHGYANFMSLVGTDADSLNLSEDFGILGFSDSSERMHAVLSPTMFRISNPVNGEGRFDRDTRIIQYFDRLNALNFGECDSRTGIVRWDPEWMEVSGGEKFASRLKNMFRAAASRVRHVVTIRPECCNDEIERYIEKLVGWLRTNSGELRITSVSMAKRCKEVQPIDGRYGGRLTVQRDFEFAITMIFEDVDALRHYYQHEEHSLQRQALYCALCPEMEAEFDSVRDAQGKGEAGVVDMFRTIEEKVAAKSLVRRYDVWDDEPVSSIVSRQGKPP
jgi:hypothetical protein